MNSSSPPRLPAPEAALRRRWLSLALLAVALHGIWIMLPPSRRAQPGPAGRLPVPTDDTPELLRLSRAGDAPAGLSGLPVGLPPPPPPPNLLPQAAAPLGAGPASGSSLGPAPGLPLPAALPQPPLPLRLVEAAAQLRSLLAQPPPAALSAADRDGLVALQRRQWWLAAAQTPLLQRLWQHGAAVPVPPAALAGLPQAAELRRLPAGPLPGLGDGDWHGHSLVAPEAALLLWRQAGSLWVLRLPSREPSREPAAETLTGS